jgi:predicted dithiol-disulfide oxidoreductase (DUF899 family)
MPFIYNQIEAQCGANTKYLLTENFATVINNLDNQKGNCDGCTYKIDHISGRITLLSTDRNRKCVLTKAPIAVR